MPRPALAPAPIVPALFVGVPEVARILGLGLTTTWALLKTSQLASVQIGRRRVVAVKELERFAAQLQGRG